MKLYNGLQERVNLVLTQNLEKNYLGGEEYFFTAEDLSGVVMPHIMEGKIEEFFSGDELPYTLEVFCNLKGVSVNEHAETIAISVLSAFCAKNVIRLIVHFYNKKVDDYEPSTIVDIH